MFSDEVIGLSFAHAREMRQFGHAAQNLVNEMDGDIIRLRRRLRAAESELARERGLRLVAEARLEELLDMEI